MGGVAALAQAMGYCVTGSDAHVYPPMSTQLEALGIAIQEGFDVEHLNPKPDCVIIGNAMKRGNPAVEYVLSEGLPYTSGPQWLAEQVLRDRWVLAVAGTHGKTTTSSMLAWILEAAGLNPGFLIGGVPLNFERSSRLGESPYFVIEADEYDSAFFDKRSKHIHYRPKTLVINNLEFDHADIFTSLADIQRQFHHLVRTIPATGRIIYPTGCEAINEVLEQGCWTPRQTIGLNDAAALYAKLLAGDGSCFEVYAGAEQQGTVNWRLLGEHNVFNALAAIAAAQHAGVPVAQACEALAHFQSVKRRMEVKAKVGELTLYDDFAHHPTAIATTLQGLRQRVGPDGRIVVLLQLQSYTMRTGYHADSLAQALQEVDGLFVLKPSASDWDVEAALNKVTSPVAFYDNTSALASAVLQSLTGDEHIVMMSNSSFDGVGDKLIAALGVPV